MLSVVKSLKQSSLRETPQPLSSGGCWEGRPPWWHTALSGGLQGLRLSARETGLVTPGLQRARIRWRLVPVGAVLPSHVVRHPLPSLPAPCCL